MNRILYQTSVKGPQRTSQNYLMNNAEIWARLEMVLKITPLSSVETFPADIKMVHLFIYTLHSRASKVHALFK